MGFAEFIIGPARGRTRWLNPSYADYYADYADSRSELVRSVRC
jgi:hypothetical protein